MIDIKATQQRLASLAGACKAYLELSGKDHAKLTKADMRRMEELAKDLSAVLEPGPVKNLVVGPEIAARFFDTKVRTLQHWVKTRGCPKLKHGLYDLTEVHKWWLENIYSAADSAEIQEIKTEYWRWKTANERMKAEQASGELIPRANVASAWSARMAEVGAGLYALSSRLSHLLDVPEQQIFGEVKRLHESYCRTGRFCVATEEDLPRPSRRRPGRPRKRTK